MAASWQAHLWSFFLRHTFKKKLAQSKDAAAIRAIMDRSFFKAPLTVLITPARLGQTDGEWVEPFQKASKLLLYLHGGGYVACNVKTHRPYTVGFALRGFRVYAPAYRLAPEHRFPAGIDDCVDAYRALRLEYPDSPICVAGDSAGGGLTLATLLRLRDAGDPLPCAAVLFSPFADLAGTGPSRQKNDRRCAMFHAAGLNTIANFYLPQGVGPKDPLASPVFADLRGLPPLLIHVGADETLLDDSTMVAARARAAGVSVECKIWPAVSHVWQMFPMLPEAKQSLDEAAAFLVNHWIAGPQIARRDPRDS